MSDMPTFHVADDYVALMELKPAERTVYGLLRCNARFARQGVADHTVHVTGQWFTEMTSHWENPIPASTARRALNGLIKKGVLKRLNDPKDGSGFALAFVADPRGQIDGPVNGFQHAKRVNRRCGSRVYYDRREDLPGDPSVTGIRLGQARYNWTPGKGDEPAPRSEPAPAPDEQPNEMPAQPTPAQQMLATPASGDRFDVDPEPTECELPPQVEVLAEALERKTARLNTPGHRLTRAQCRQVATECAPALALGWDPALLAARMVDQMGPKIHTPVRFLPKKAAELGAPPAQPAAPMSADGSDSRPPLPRPATPPHQHRPAAPTLDEAVSGAAGDGMRRLAQLYADRHQNAAARR